MLCCARCSEVVVLSLPQVDQISWMLHCLWRFHLEVLECTPELVLRGFILECGHHYSDDDSGDGLSFRLHMGSQAPEGEDFVTERMIE